MCFCFVLLFNIFLVMRRCEDVVCPHVAVCMSADTLGGHKCQVPWSCCYNCCELHCVGARDQTEVPRKSSKHSWWLSHPPSTSNNVLLNELFIFFPFKLCITFSCCRCDAWKVRDNVTESVCPSPACGLPGPSGCRPVWQVSLPTATSCCPSFF